MDFKIFTAGQNDNSRRFDKVIRKFIPDVSLTLIYKYIRKGLIKVNQKKTTQDYHIQEGDKIYIADFILNNENKSDKSDEKLKSEKKNIVLPPVVFRNEHILIINKPYDVTVHGFSDSLDKLVAQEYKNSSQNNSLSFTPGPLHRLDKKTTGLLAFSQSLEGAQWFSKNIQNHIIQKKYYAVLQGKLEKKCEYQDKITKNESEKNGFHTVTAQTSEDNNAHTIVYPKFYGKYENVDFTVAEVEIKTGKTHQIRAQCSLHGYPLLGDTAYNGRKLNKKYPDFFLQAYSLTFPENNPVNLPPKIEIDFSNSLKKFLNDCDVKIFGL